MLRRFDNIDQIYYNSYLEKMKYKNRIFYLKLKNIKENDILKVKFIDNVDISGKININKGEIFEAREDGDFIMIRMKDDSTVKAPKSEIEGILEIVEGE